MSEREDEIDSIALPTSHQNTSQSSGEDLRALHRAVEKTYEHFTEQWRRLTSTSQSSGEDLRALHRAVEKTYEHFTEQWRRLTSTLHRAAAKITAEHYS